MKKRFRVSYNAPVTLTFAILCVFIFLLDKYALNGKLIPALFIVPGNKNAAVSFVWNNALDYIRLFTHVFGHADWNHFLSNFAFILLLGPLMEERYGSSMICLMFTVTAFVTGVINVCFIPSSLMGASGISFMLILLAAISTITKNEIPLSFIFVLAVYIGREVISTEQGNMSNISAIAHAAGGLCGSLFGFLVAPKAKSSEKKKLERIQQIDNDSPRYKKQSSRDDETTVIGTIQL